MQMSPIQQNDLRTMIKRKAPVTEFPDMCWENPLGRVCLFLNGRVLTSDQIAWQIFKEERASRTVTIEQYRDWLKTLPSPSLPLIKDILSLCLKKEITTKEMGRMVENIPDEWKRGIN